MLKRVTFRENRPKMKAKISMRMRVQRTLKKTKMIQSYLKMRIHLNRKKSMKRFRRMKAKLSRIQARSTKILAKLQSAKTSKVKNR